jgi:flavin reductase (DIM6/NTAB) family NADH-FMN oxidoreductase RutF
MKREIDAFDYATEIARSTRKGVLLSTRADKFDTMAISFGTLGTLWGRPVFTVFVRDSHYTFEQLAKNPEFTISVPLGDFDRKVLGKAGTLSGWEVDKADTLGITLEEPVANSVPGIRELPLTLECKVIYRKEIPLDEIGLSKDEVDSEYPPDANDRLKPRNNRPHTEFVGEIVAAYVIE